MADHYDARDPREALRAIWDARGESGALLDDDASPTKFCKNMNGVTFDGFAEPGTDLRAAWRDRLAREGKLAPGGESVRDLVLGDSDPH